MRGGAGADLYAARILQPAKSSDDVLAIPRDKAVPDLLIE